MTVSKPFSRALLFMLLLCSIVSGCSPQAPTTIAVTLASTPLPTVMAIETFLPVSILIPDTGWRVLQPGLERRMIRLFDAQGQHVESLYIYRLDQTRFRLDVAYHERPQHLDDWQRETSAVLVVNGGFFRVENDQYFPNGLTVVNGQIMGTSYDSFGGMLTIQEGWAELRWLVQTPYDPAEPVQAALQSFPVLVKPGGELGFPAEHEDNLRARRTVIAQDRVGRILIIVAPRGHFTLHQLSLYLTGSDLDLDIAINLDGGPSSGIMVAEPREVIPAQTILPIVILAYRR